MQFKQITSNDTQMLNEKGMKYFKNFKGSSQDYIFKELKIEVKRNETPLMKSIYTNHHQIILENCK